MFFRNKEPGEEIIVKKKVNNYFMYIDKNGRGIHRDLFLHGIREPGSTQIVKSLLKKGDVCLEVGSNIGYYALLESKIVGTKGLVYAIEPIKENVSFLKKNVSLNKSKNIKIHNIGISDKKGKIKISVCGEGNLNTPGKVGDALRVDEVKSESIDSFFSEKKKPTFMRMDIEGYENVVFSGAKKTLKDLNILFVELHFNLILKNKMKKLLLELKSYGFEIKYAILEWERWESEDNILGRLVNFLHRKRSKPRVYKDMTIDSLIKNDLFMKSHHCLEVFFVKRSRTSFVNR